MAGRKIRIAVVDDDVNYLRALERLLRASGFEPFCYSTAGRFLQATIVPPPDCVVLDIRLDTVTGFDVARQLGADASDVPVIFITAHDDAETREQARQLGCAAYLRKPFSAGLLIDAIRQALPAAEESP